MLSILIVLKTLMFISLTHVIHNQTLILLTTMSISFSIIWLLSLLHKTRNKVYLGIFYTLFSFVMFIDVVYYSYFNTLPSVEMLGMMGMLYDVQNSVFSIISTKLLLFLIDLPFVYYYLYKCELLYFTNDIKLKISGILAVFVIFNFSYGFNNNIFNSLRYQEIYTYHSNDILLNIAGDDLKNPQHHNSLYSESDIEILREKTKSLEGPSTGVGKGKNLIVLQVEALQNFVINLNYNNQEITPNLNNLIKDNGSIYYDNYFQLLGRGNTSDAEFVTNNSLHPSMETPTYTQYENNTFYGLPWVLRDNGYNAWVFHGYEKTFWNRDKAYENQGFQRYLSQDDYEIKDIIELGITDGDFFEQSMKYLKELDSIDNNPFYAFIITLSSHNPFTMPDEYKEIELLEEHKDTILGDYLNSIHYVDKAIGEFFKDLKEENLYNESVIALYGDHFAIPNFSTEVIETMDEFLGEDYNYDHIMNVPLIINVPNTDIGYTNNKVGSLIDFFPTILNILGLDNEKGIVFGVDLENYDGYNNVKPQTVMRKGSFIDEEVIFSWASTEVFEHSTVINRNTKEQLNPEDYREIYEDVINEINLSNYILRKDLLKPLIEKGKAFGGVAIPTPVIHSNIIKLKENTIEELDKVHKSQSDYISIDLTLNEDEVVVLDNTEYTLSDNLVTWSEENEHVMLLVRTNIDDEEFYNKLRYAIPHSKTEYIIEIDSFDEFYFVQSYGFEKIILNNSYINYTEKELNDFINAHNLYGIIVNRGDLSSNLKNKIHKQGTIIYEEKSDFFKVIR